MLFPVWCMQGGESKDTEMGDGEKKANKGKKRKAEGERIICATLLSPSSADPPCCCVHCLAEADGEGEEKEKPKEVIADLIVAIEDIAADSAVAREDLKVRFTAQRSDLSLPLMMLVSCDYGVLST